MQIIYLPVWLMVLSYVIIWPSIQISISLIGKNIDIKYFDPNSWLFRTKNWEKNGEIYDEIFSIRKWKDLLPDGAKLQKGGFTKANLKSRNKEYINRFILETCRGEIIHLVQILPFWIFGLWSPTYVIWIMLIYALSVNLPCILVQRYNRPRLIKLYENQLKNGEIRL